MPSLLRVNYKFIAQLAVCRFSTANVPRKVSYEYGLPRGPLMYKTIPQVINDAAEKWPQKPFIVSVAQNLTKNFKEVNDDANRLASALLSIGVKKGDRVGIWSPNCYEWIITQFGTAKIGAILVNVNPAYRQSELIYCANLVGLETLISSQKLKSSDYVALLESASPGIFDSSNGIGVSSKTMPTLKNLIYIENPPEEIAPAKITRFWDLIGTHGCDEPKLPWLLDPEDVYNIQFTSGTTGNPKGAPLTHHGTTNNAYFSSIGYLDDVTLCVPNPLYHCFGSVNGSLGSAIMGNTVVLPAPVFAASATLDAIDKLKCNVVFGTPTMYVDLLREKKSHEISGGSSSHDLSSVKYIYMSGAPCPEKITREMHKSLFPNLKRVVIPYGTTEVSPVITLPRMEMPQMFEHTTVGSPLDHSEVKIVDSSTGETVERGKTGELWTRSVYVFPGYWNSPEKSAETIDNRGWYKTG